MIWAGNLATRIKEGGVRSSHLSTMTASAGGITNEAATGLCADVIPVPILNDNYAYLVVDRHSGKAACVDPAEPEKVIAAAEKHGVTISALLCTHKHWDHAGGNEAMKKMIPDLEVVSSAYEDSVPATTLALRDKETYSLGSLSVTALHTPCHTRGHVLFFVAPADRARRGGGGEGAPLLFSGDTLFVGGCGRFFEGDAREMLFALRDVAAKLPGETRVFCGHEYTVSNLRFAQSVEPKSEAVAKKLKWSQDVLSAGQYTVPSTIFEELQHNPFMRTGEKAVQLATGTTDGVEVMSRLREMKNCYRPPPQTAGSFPML
ncbi:unnamed protein product [Discosporangium mesarthrocarpum]